MYQRPSSRKRSSVCKESRWSAVSSLNAWSMLLGRSQKQRKRIKSVALDWTAVGRRIRELRGFETTQQEFVDRIGISQKYVSDMELGKVEVGTEILLRIARAFGRTIEWLLTGEDRP